MKDIKNWYKVLSTFMIVVLLIGTITSTASAKSNKQTFEEEIEVSEEEVELLAKSLELVYESGQVTQNNKLIGFNQQKFEEELAGLEGSKEVIQQLEENNLFAEVPEQIISPRLAACAWHGMKEKPAYIKAENTCIKNGLKANYGPVTTISTIANLIADKEFTLAAKKIIALGIRSNIAGVIVTVSSILLDCSKKMEKKFPGKTNCY
ncbi:hypothetical protein [Bacillus xiapuensis]|uniref:hypothetical protein n=1 Tax=Bacillus xiapuensis TaxID=2014075 RepID=UPI000C24FD30|nr:hypothetical protein [Bacillus xiapuensis]